MIKDLFPAELIGMITNRFNLHGIYEIRIRAEKPIFINYFGEYIELRGKVNEVVCADKRLIEFVMSRATEMSVYRYNTQIKQGFLTTSKGVRIGIAGEVIVSESNEVVTIKNPTGLVIRIPHEIKNCAHEVIPYIIDKFGVKNTLIISPPACGKTTFIRDIARTISYENKVYNILIVDERYEISGNENLDVGVTSDVIFGGTKEFAFSGGIRALRPDVIITDEIGAKSDVDAIKNASLSGVKVIATAHAENESDLKKKRWFKDLVENKIFDRIVVLSARNGVGTVEGIFNSSFEPIV